MQYGQIVFLLFIVLLLYYAVLIVLDIQKTKAAQAAEQDGQTEEEIDISDEAQTFKPVKISRDEPVKKQEASRKDEAEEPDAQEPLDTEKPFHRPGYREAIMTDGILVEDIIHEINRLAETGTSDLGTVIFNCENAM